MNLITFSTLAGLILAAPPCHGQTVVGRPCLFSDYFAEWRSFPAILRDPEGNLFCGRNRLNNGGATQGPPAAGTPAATAIPRTERFGPQAHFTYRDTAGRIQDLWFERYREKDRWHVESLNGGGKTWAPAAAGDPSGTQFRSGFHVAYRDFTGGIQHLWSDGKWHAQRLNQGGATGAPGAAGDPVQIVQGGRQHVFYLADAGTLQDVWFDGAWHVDPVNNGGKTGAPAAAGDPAAVGLSDAYQLAYRDDLGGIQEVVFDGSWHWSQLNEGGETDAPPAQGNPSVRVVGGTTRHVTYRDPAGNIQDLWFDGTWHVQRLNRGGLTSAAPAASDPVSLVPPSNWEYVAYVDIYGEAQLLSHPKDGPWQVTRLTDPDFRIRSK